jgi:hypothetical protein
MLVQIPLVYVVIVVVLLAVSLLLNVVTFAKVIMQGAELKALREVIDQRPKRSIADELMPLLQAGIQLVQAMDAPRPPPSSAPAASVFGVPGLQPGDLP